MIIKNKVEEVELKRFLLSLSDQTKKTFNYFNEISEKTIDEIVKNEIFRKDKMKFFAFKEKKLAGYGFLTLFNKSTKKHNCILGIVIGDNWQSKGIGRKMCEKMIKEAWKSKLTKIWLTVHEENKKAVRLYKSLGFQLEGVFIKDEMFNGKYKNIVSLALFKDKINHNKKRITIWKDLEF